MSRFFRSARLGLFLLTYLGAVSLSFCENNVPASPLPTHMVETTILAGKAWNFGSANGVGISAYFYDPRGIAVDHQGNVYVADCNNDLIRKITH